MLSTTAAHVANAAPRWSAATATTRAASPIANAPMRWLAAMARTPDTDAAISSSTSIRVCSADGCAE